jgi:hypothetical protein
VIGMTRPLAAPAAPARDRVMARIDATRIACRTALDTSVAWPSARVRTAARLDRASQSDEALAQSMARLQRYARSESDADEALAHLPPDGPARALVVREDLLRGAIEALGQVTDLPVAPAVKIRICDVLRMFCEAPREDRELRLRPDLGFHGCALAACALLARFPAGQLDWQVSGLARSYLWRIPFAHVPRFLRMLVRDLGGRQPCFVAHMGVRRYPLLFVEAESHRSYHRMAQSMTLQPEVRGLLMEAWFHSPEAIRVSPHLAWTNRTPLAHGATLTDLGPAPPQSGFLTGSPDRQRLYEAGAYRPTIGLIIWPRPALLAWAAAHPEFGVEGDTG